MPFYVYIIKCGDGSYYTGHTDHLENRLNQHHSRYFPACYTASRFPLELVFLQSFETRIDALSRERQLKGWSRKKKQALIAGNWAELQRLARNRQNDELRQASLRQAQGERGVDECTVCSEPVGSISVRGEPVEPDNLEPYNSFATEENA